MDQDGLSNCDGDCDDTDRPVTDEWRWLFLFAGLQ